SRRYITAFETWAEAALAESPSAVIDEIDAVIRTDPYRERLRVIQRAALHQQGRYAQALAVFDDYRQALAREFGLPPGPAVVRMRDQVLREQPEPAPSTVEPNRSLALPRLPGVAGRSGF